MSQQCSPRTNKLYGLKRVSKVGGLSRSSFYYKPKTKAAMAKPGPEAAYDDAKLFKLIKKDLSASPFYGEGHRKVAFRLKRRIKVSKHRVLKVMRDHNLLAPVHRGSRKRRTHNGKLAEAAPDLTWGTDGTRFYVKKEGWCWLFIVIDHFNSEVIGWHLAKTGSKFAAMEPVFQAIRRRFGVPKKDIATGLQLRMDNGTQYTSKYFQKELKLFGIAPSHTCVGSPESNGIAERFFRTIKEQVIYGKYYNSIDVASNDISLFINKYNNTWNLARLGYKSPVEYHQIFESRIAA